MQRNTYNNNNNESADSDLVFVIETCQNCKSHTWNTRHDENKYLDYFNKGKSPPTLLTYLQSPKPSLNASHTP